MDATIKKQWVEALRSGKYAQGKGKLVVNYASNKKDASYCCLGVLCEIRGLEVGEDSQGYFGYVYKGTHNWTLLPPKLGEEIGLTIAQQNRLASLNDTGMTFTEIATAIEETL